MAIIKVSSKTLAGGWEFDVTVSDRESETKHNVTMDRKYYKQLDTKSTPEVVVKKSFEFLLEREPKESILSEFNIEIIAKYFPEFEDAVKKF